MSKLKSIDELRDLADDMNPNEIVEHMKLYPSCVFDGAWLDGWRLEFDRLLAAIEQEVDERYIELPLDADGAPIRVGDKLKSKYGPKPFIVESMEFGSAWTVWDSENGATRWPNECRHVKPRTVEDVLREFVGEYQYSSGPDYDEECVSKFAAELRMAGE